MISVHNPYSPRLCARVWTDPLAWHINHRIIFIKFVQLILTNCCHQMSDLLAFIFCSWLRFVNCVIKEMMMMRFFKRPKCTKFDFGPLLALDPLGLEPRPFGLRSCCSHAFFFSNLGMSACSNSCTSSTMLQCRLLLLNVVFNIIRFTVSFKHLMNCLHTLVYGSADNTD